MPTLIKKIDLPKKKILFLGYARHETTLIDTLLEQNCEVWHSDERIHKIDNYDLVISFGYRFILKKPLVDCATIPIINLHISYLPWNRGAHPNFWSLYDRTPSGVTIHLIDDGIDTGSIICQQYVHFHESENTFTKTYIRLKNEVESLFKANLNRILLNQFQATPQRGIGTYHKKSDLPKEFSGWDSEISSELLRLDSILIKKE